MDEIRTEPGTPTQVANPKRTTLRTALQTAIGVIGGLASALLLAAVIAPQLLEALRDVLSPQVYAVGATLVAGIVGAAAALTKIMAIPTVAAWIERYLPGLAPIKR